MALRKEGTLLGAITIYRQEVRIFSDKQIALLENFAAQAVIAIENARLLTEQREALDQQTATAEVLQVINASPGDIVPVFETILEKAHALCGVAYGSLQLYDGEKFRAVAVHGLPQALADELRAGYLPGPTHPVRPLLAGEDSVQIPDMAGLRGASSALRSSGLGTALFVALRKDDLLLGQIVATRNEIRPFTNKETSLLQNFAQQAVIAMENARLLTEQREALEQQTATADILRVISQSPTDVQPVLKAVVGAARRFCGADDAMVVLREETEQLLATHEGSLQSLVGSRFPLDRSSATGRATIDGQTFHVPDVASLDPAEHALTIELTRRTGVRALLAAPMLREGHAIGCILLRRPTPGAFTPRQIELLEVFAAQAVIAIENVRLFNELQSSNDGLKEALDKQTATSEILRVISGSPTNVEPVFRTILANANTLCDASFSLLWLWEGEALRAVAHEHVNVSPKLAEFIAKARPRPHRHTPLGLSVLERTVVHVEDVLADPRFVPEEVPIYRLEGARSILAVPMVREGILVGVINIWRREPGAFTDGQKALVQTFADQAVIAIENVRLFRELEERNADLTEALEQQTATSEVLKAISHSAFDLGPVFEAVVENAVKLCDAERAFLFRFDGRLLRAAASYNASPTLREWVHNNPIAPGRQSISARAALEQRTVHVPDVQADPEYGYALRDSDPIGTILAVPMLKGDSLIGTITIYKLKVSPFTDKQIALVETFAAQAVIAIENVRLFTELRESLEQQTATGEILRVIAQSPTDVKPVLDVVANAALRFCGANDVQVCLREAEKWFVAVHLGPLSSKVGERRILDRQTGPGRAITDGKTVHLADVQGLDAVEFAEARKLGTALGFNSALCAPMMRDEVAIGGISLRRPQTGSFSERQIALLESFAAQAVIAIENVRLFTELRESLEQQTASAAVLRVISQSPTDVQPVLDAVADGCLRFCGAEDAAVIVCATATAGCRGTMVRSRRSSVALSARTARH